MTVKTSYGLRTYLAVTGSLKEAFDGGQVMFYEGTEPATADAAVAGTVCWTVTAGGAGTGVTFEAVAVDTACVKETTETWQGPTVAGTPNYWRLIGATEKAGTIGAYSTTNVRIQGTCGNLATSDIFLTTPTVVTDSDVDAKILDAFSILVFTNI